MQLTVVGSLLYMYVARQCAYYSNYNGNTLAKLVITGEPWSVSPGLNKENVTTACRDLTETRFNLNNFRGKINGSLQ